MLHRPHYLPDIILALLFCIFLRLAFRSANGLAMRARRRVQVCLWVCAVVVAAGTALGIPSVAFHFNHVFVAWTRCLSLVLTAGFGYTLSIIAAMRRVRLFDPSRRAALGAAAFATVAAPAAVSSFAIMRREDLTFREVDLRIPSLPPGLNGLRIAQLTDIHLSPFVSERTLRHAIGMANETRPHLTLVTGDLISTHGDPLDLCLSCLKGLRADAGLFGCLGNHERYAGAEDYTERYGAEAGIRFLRREAVDLHFGGSRLTLAGVDYQAKSRPYLVGAESLISPGSYNVLLSHNPDVFPVAAKKGFDLTIAGHTHGGQVNLEMLVPGLNPARFSTPYVYGPYEKSDKRMYVSRGIGTIGVPARLGAPPEVVLLRLCAI